MPFIPGRVNLGPDHSLAISKVDASGNAGGLITLDGQRSKFESQFEDELTKTTPIDSGGQVTGINQPGGVSGSIEVEKGGNDFDQMVMANNLGYYTRQPGQYYQMIETILDPSTKLISAVNVYRDVVFHSYHRGGYEHRGTVKATVQFFATDVQPG